MLRAFSLLAWTDTALRLTERDLLLALGHFHISFYYGNKVQCLLCGPSLLCLLVAQGEEEKHIHPNCIMIWCSFDSFEHGQATWFWFCSLHAGQSCCVLLEIVFIYPPAQSSPTSDSSHGAHGYILEALGCCVPWLRCCLPRWHSMVLVMFA